MFGGLTLKLQNLSVYVMTLDRGSHFDIVLYLPEQQLHGLGCWRHSQWVCIWILKHQSHAKKSVLYVAVPNLIGTNWL